MRPKIGDVIELSTSKGLTYIQYSAQNDFGQLVRVLPGFFPQPVEDFQKLVEEKERYFAYVLLPTFLPEDHVRIVARLEVPPRAQGVPLMKFSLYLPSGAISQDWWLTDGDRQWHVGELTSEQEELSIAEELLSIEALIDRLYAGWSPKDFVRKGQQLSADDLEFEALVFAVRSGAELLPSGEIDVPNSRIRHLLLCEGEAQAKGLASAIRTAGFEVELDHPEDDEDEPFWTIVARPSSANSDSLVAQAEELEALASEHGASYDGHEIEID